MERMALTKGFGIMREWIKSIDEIVVIHKLCNTTMYFESQASNKNAIFSCPYCKKRIKINLEK
jgi:hypothetical protein